jgi:hypothetical protein
MRIAALNFFGGFSEVSYKMIGALKVYPKKLFFG